MSTTADMEVPVTHQSSWHYGEAENCCEFKGSLGWISKPYLKTPKAKRSEAKQSDQFKTGERTLQLGVLVAVAEDPDDGSQHATHQDMLHATCLRTAGPTIG